MYVSMQSGCKNAGRRRQGERPDMSVKGRYPHKDQEAEFMEGSLTGVRVGRVEAALVAAVPPPRQLPPRQIHHRR